MRAAAIVPAVLALGVAAGCGATSVDREVGAAGPASSAVPSATAAIESATAPAVAGGEPDATTSTRPTTATTVPAPTATATATTTTTPTTTAAPTTTVAPPTTSCERVVQIGDSTGVDLWEAQNVDGADNTIEARYRSVGVETVLHDDSGGRAIEEHYQEGQANAFEVALALRKADFHGCWVLMLGTNDAANVASGAAMSSELRILRMLYVIGDDPVLWVDAVTSGVPSAYRNESMRAWNDVLYRIADERDNVEVFRWSERVRPEWFADGIHYTTEGRIWRAALTALALVESFPA